MTLAILGWIFFTFDTSISFFLASDSLLSLFLFLTASSHLFPSVASSLGGTHTHYTEDTDSPHGARAGPLRTGFSDFCFFLFNALTNERTRNGPSTLPSLSKLAIRARAPPSSLSSRSPGLDDQLVQSCPGKSCTGCTSYSASHAAPLHPPSPETARRPWRLAPAWSSACGAYTLGSRGRVVHGLVVRGGAVLDGRAPWRGAIYTKLCFV
jgi:hypothetical protein